jgi:hypothetical protein
LRGEGIKLNFLQGKKCNLLSKSFIVSLQNCISIESGEKILVIYAFLLKATDKATVENIALAFQILKQP